MYKCLIFEAKDSIAAITLNRPDFFNAFNEEQSYELQDALKKTEKNDQIRVVVLTGAGKAFCSGQDLKSIVGETRPLSEAVRKCYIPIIKAMRDLPKPIICRLNGVAAGAGCSLALASDFIIASEKASLIEVFVSVGLVLDSGSSYFLPRVVGSAKAFELSTMGTKVNADEALKLGMVNRVVPHDKLDEAVDEIVNYYANAPTKAIALIKTMLNKSFHLSLEEALELEAQYQEIAGNSEDYQEGLKAFIEKRKAEFKGR
ncbi:MAG: 2-(1,2-epoxy-1,2-dihydrophenyl)acetyl-CoA isomerase [Cytophagales bacterium]|nr:2-(1,2-epoxy-1,2-dihydrophenyl)acetyl-CoA isomerase [Cytophagales bacterium]